MTGATDEGVDLKLSDKAETLRLEFFFWETKIPHFSLLGLVNFVVILLSGFAFLMYTVKLPSAVHSIANTHNSSLISQRRNFTIFTCG